MTLLPLAIDVAIELYHRSGLSPRVYDDWFSPSHSPQSVLVPTIRTLIPSIYTAKTSDEGN